METSGEANRRGWPLGSLPLFSFPSTSPADLPSTPPSPHPGEIALELSQTRTGRMDPALTVRPSCCGAVTVACLLLTPLELPRGLLCVWRTKELSQRKNMAQTALVADVVEASGRRNAA